MQNWAKETIAFARLFGNGKRRQVDKLLGAAWRGGRREFVRKGDFFFDRLPNRDLDRTSQATAHSILAASYTEPLLLGRELPSYFTLGHKKWMAWIPDQDVDEKRYS